MGEMKVPAGAYYGASTQRAVENFPVSGEPMPAAFIHALGLIKAAAARVNRELGLVDGAKAEAIEKAAGEVAAGPWAAPLPLDAFQTRSRTGTHQNRHHASAPPAPRP